MAVVAVTDYQPLDLIEPEAAVESDRAKEMFGWKPFDIYSSVRCKSSCGRTRQESYHAYPFKQNRRTSRAACVFKRRHHREVRSQHAA